jgi:hypothetical protein
MENDDTWLWLWLCTAVTAIPVGALVAFMLRV